MHRELTAQYVRWLDAVESGVAADVMPRFEANVLRNDPQLKACLLRTVMRDASRVRRKRAQAQDSKKLGYDMAPPWVKDVKRHGLPVPVLRCDPRQVQVAYHESGHAVAMRALGAPVQSVELYRDSKTAQLFGKTVATATGYGGRTIAEIPDTSIYGADARITGAIAGNIAEELAGFEPHDFAAEAGATDNALIARVACDSAMTPQVFEMTMDRCRDHAYDILRANWHKVDRLTTFLLDHGKASANEVALLLEG
jgi:hypothetical protein